MEACKTAAFMFVDVVRMAWEGNGMLLFLLLGFVDKDKSQVNKCFPAFAANTKVPSFTQK